MLPGPDTKLAITKSSSESVKANNQPAIIAGAINGNVISNTTRNIDDELTWLWDVTTQADKQIIVNNARGVRSKYYQPGPFSGMEAQERDYIEWLLQELQRA